MTRPDEPIQGNENPGSEDQPSSFGCLVALNGSALGRFFKLTQTRQLVGSSSKSAIALTDPGITARHAELVFDGETIVLNALEPNADCYVNGKPVRRQVLTPGDRLQFGDVATFKYSVPAGGTPSLKPSTSPESTQVTNSSGDVEPELTAST